LKAQGGAHICSASKAECNKDRYDRMNIEI